MLTDLCKQDYLIIEHFLPETQFLALKRLAAELHQQGLFSPAGIGQNQDKQVNQRVRKDCIYWLDEATDYSEVSLFLAQLKRYASLLNEALFLNLIELEGHFAHYAPGSFYKRHRDQFRGNNARQISCVYYLNEDWSEKDGGELILYEDKERTKATILPQGNRFVCFRSHLEHEVKQTMRERISITAWLKTRTGFT